MLRLALLLILPLAAVCVPTPPAKIYFLQYLEDSLKPCVMNDTCPPDMSYDNTTSADIIRALREHTTQEECNCSLTADSCIRSCYYALTVDIHMIMTAAGRTNGKEIQDLQEVWQQMLQSKLKPCVIDSKDCELIGSMDKFDIHHLKTELASYSILFSLPDECKCNLDTESCLRPCYYTTLKKSGMIEKPSGLVTMLLLTAFEPRS